MREWTVRYYIDADILGLAKVLTPLRGDITFPGDPGATIYKRTRPPCPITGTETLDTDWLPIVAARGWLVITRDHNIRENIAERRAVRESGTKMVALAGRDAVTKWGQLELVMSNWTRIEELAAQIGPFIYLAGRNGLRRLSLDE
jgi:hypothetical protein